MRALLVLALVAAVVDVPCKAQVALVGAEVDPLLFAPASFLRMSVSNSGAPVAVVFSGEVRSKEEGVVLTFRSSSFLLGTGAHQLRSSALAIQDFRLGGGQRARTAGMERRLPAGPYTYCIRVEPVQSGEFQDELCDALTAEDRLFMDLVHPYDGDTIEELRPTLSWTITGAKVPPGQIARGILVPIGTGMDAYQAIAGERPVFVSDHLQRMAIAYPAGVPDLERGRCYAWQVERYLDGSSIDRTEAWRFCVRDRKLPEADRYVLLDDRASSAVYDAPDGRVNFRWDAEYANVPLSCSLLDGKGRLIAAAPQQETLVPIPMGPGLYALDLAALGFPPGDYVLQVNDGKDRSRRLNVHYER